MAKVSHLHRRGAEDAVDGRAACHHSVRHAGDAELSRQRFENRGFLAQSAVAKTEHRRPF